MIMIIYRYTITIALYRDEQCNIIQPQSHLLFADELVGNKTVMFIGCYWHWPLLAAKYILMFKCVLYVFNATRKLIAQI